MCLEMHLPCPKDKVQSRLAYYGNNRLFHHKPTSVTFQVSCSASDKHEEGIPAKENCGRIAAVVHGKLSCFDIHRHSCSHEIISLKRNVEAHGGSAIGDKRDGGERRCRPMLWRGEEGAVTPSREGRPYGQEQMGSASGVERRSVDAVEGRGGCREVVEGREVAKIGADRLRQCRGEEERQRHGGERRGGPD
ncbi:uncharacterized protein LOC125507867 [Triticum urartu]|nr:uncharacterized protein LOC125507867 [Triticum urartu]XP_048528346.1 uncharacterized protein LOC125507867 [Triticum urartu]XP_048528347.1 uncharacterized protein LOC125507867 [Triticum urartu]XP_048528348.1 uncharacterized protein LOC125507867 [Triticum urartu]XP_048528349.1 uncharacterized protein LOC125507867 [Triticum urartu]